MPAMGASDKGAFVESAFATPGRVASLCRPRARLVSFGLLIAIAACAGKTPPPAAPAAPAPPPPPPPVAGIPSGPPVELTPAAAAHAHELATISIGSFDRLLQNGTKLVGQAMPLPMDAAGVRDLLFSQAGLSPEIAANLDLASPCSAVFVAVGKGDDGKARTGVVLAVAARGPAEAEKVIGALGKKIMVRGPVTLIDNGAKSQGWVYRAGNVIVLGDELEGIARGALLALEARRPGPEEITATLYPDAIARANNTDVKSAVAKVIEEMKSKKTEVGSTPGAGDATEIAAELLSTLAEADVGEIGLGVDPARGLTLRGRLRPRAATRLQAIAKDVVPFEIDPAVAAGEKGAAAALAYYDAFLAAMGTQQSASITVQKQAPYLAGLFSTTLTDAAGGAKIAATLGRLDKAAVSALMTAQLGRTVSFDLTAKAERVGKLKATHSRIKMKKMEGVDSDLLKRLLSAEMDVYWAVDGQRLLVAFGRDAKARLAAATGSPAPQLPTSGPQGEARAAAKGRDAFYYFDVTPMLTLAGTLSDDKNGRMAALSRAGAGPIPLVFTAGGDGVGKTWTAELTIPPAAFSSVGALILAGAAAGAGATK
jgi:hypothetical protein